jgi:hypothetical protein
VGCNGNIFETGYIVRRLGKAMYVGYHMLPVYTQYQLDDLYSTNINNTMGMGRFFVGTKYAFMVKHDGTVRKSLGDTVRFL